MTHKRAQHALVKWLAFTALVLIVFAPTVSRTWVAWSQGHEAAGLVSDCPEHAAHAQHPGEPEHPVLPDGDACSYCTLMGHSPPLASGVAFLVFPLPPAPFSIAFRGAHAPAPEWLDQRSRGPPVV
ncbi:DUF2946 domain-containing protein [Dyella sp. GSA-30]|uniref:DUF2946 domain-containing protein n=1 Tax=Dyella sp. GSA-30 TaxID=2994496 RepID=UPI0024912732|nr:DUF2946 domain-containing protein [Dyella sp. GSA-30]